MTQESFIYSFVARDEGIPVTAEKIATLVKAANVPDKSYWPGLFAKLYGKRNIEDLVLNAGFGDAVSIAAPGVAEAAAPTAAAPQHIFLFLPPRLHLPFHRQQHHHLIFYKETMKKEQSTATAITTSGRHGHARSKKDQQHEIMKYRQSINLAAATKHQRHQLCLLDTIPLSASPQSHYPNHRR
ncbi:hypothetical protein ACFX15_009025 [Malus domestica]